MTQCRQCQTCGSPDHSGSTRIGSVIIVGNLNVGKTSLFSRLTGTESQSMNVPGSTVSVQAACLESSGLMVYDTPGTYSVFTTNNDEVASRDALLMAQGPCERPGILLVADAKNLKRAVALGLQYAEYGLPMMIALNMIDEAAPRGIQIDVAKLSELLGIDVIPTVSREGLGVREIESLIPLMKVPNRLLNYPPKVEQFLSFVEKLLRESPVSPRMLGVLLLAEDQGVEEYVRREFGPGMLGQLKDLAVDFRREEPGRITTTLANLYVKKAEQLAGTVLSIDPPPSHPFAKTLGDWCIQYHTGIPIALLNLFWMYLFVGVLGATVLVDLIEDDLFRGFLIPLITKLVQPVPSAFFRDLLVDPNFGVLPTGVFLAIGIVAPVIFCFYLAFGLLEDSGYLPRLSILLDRTLRLMGLNGKGVVPLTMGFSCVTMAILTTRILDTKKEKDIASFLLFLAAPCAPLLAVMFTILDRMPFSATVFIFGLVGLQMLFGGVIANRLLPGGRGPLLLEIPPMRIPKPRLLLKSALQKTYYFMKEAIPVFILASTLIFLFQRVGGLQMMETALKPITGILLGLPEDSVQVFLKTLIRRENGAAELLNLSGHYSNLQLVVALLVMTFMVPCFNATMVLYQERGGRSAAIIVLAVMGWAVALGAFVGHFCTWAGITFS